jgi:glycosyltransferase involved in cell wall biosynthesis
VIARAPDAAKRSSKTAALLCVCNFPTNTGYAWDFIERLYAGVANALARRGVRTLVSYPKLRAIPHTLAGSAAEPVELEFGCANLKQGLKTLRFLRSHRVRALYLTDRRVCSLFYPLVRLAGVRHIVVHDHTSGERTAPRGLKRLLKWAYIRMPGASANRVIAVSDYVAARDIRTLSVLPSRIVRVWNGIPLPVITPPGGILRKLANMGADRTLVVCSCRANAVKGVDHLLRAFDTLDKQIPAGASHPVMVYIGDGPQRDELESIRNALSSRDNIVFLGYHENASQLLMEADICVVPSVWQDAFPLSVLEPMAAGKPVVATAVGGIPEMIEDGVTGLLVPPADDLALSSAIRRLLNDPGLAERIGAAARQRVAERFTPALQLRTVTEIVGRCFPPGNRSTVTS